jgi:hypothetical protein
MGLLEYSSNNSGGSWWLTDENWKALEDAGWDVKWAANRTKSSILSVDEDGRWLGALATEASKEFDSADEGISEWESITGQRNADEGCNCCGPPHNFSFVSDEGETSYSTVEVTGTIRSWS